MWSPRPQHPSWPLSALHPFFQPRWFIHIHSSQAPIWTLVLHGKTALCLLHSLALLLPLIFHPSYQVIFIVQAGPRRGFMHYHSTLYELSRTPCILGYLFFSSLPWPLAWPFTAPCAQCLEYDREAFGIFFLSKFELTPV